MSWSLCGLLDWKYISCKTHYRYIVWYTVLSFGASLLQWHKNFMYTFQYMICVIVHCILKKYLMWFYYIHICKSSSGVDKGWLSPWAKDFGAPSKNIKCYIRLRNRQNKKKAISMILGPRRQTSKAPLQNPSVWGALYKNETKVDIQL